MELARFALVSWGEDAVGVENVPVPPVSDTATPTTVVKFARLGSVLTNTDAAVVARQVITSDVRATYSMDGARVRINA